MNRIGAGVDEVDVLAGMPTPTLHMAGRRDEVFRTEWSGRSAALCASTFAAASRDKRFAFFKDCSGHDYTLLRECTEADMEADLSAALREYAT